MEGGARPAIGPGRLDAMHAASCACACESDVSVICVRLRVVAVLLKACGWRRQACSVSAESRLVLRVLSCRVLVSVCGCPATCPVRSRVLAAHGNHLCHEGSQRALLVIGIVPPRPPTCGSFIWSVKSQNQIDDV